jgi:glutamine amidotransferase
LRVAIFDFGAGNLFNITLALRRQRLEAEVVQQIPQALPYDALVFPGVGNFAPAISRLDPFRERVADLAAEGTPILGICLGMQLMCESSEEGPAKGLGLVKGEVARLPDSCKIPHIGWNRLEIKAPNGVLRGIPDGSWCYFVHSYYLRGEESIVSAQTEYGVTFPSVIESGNLTGTQFHPEKSAETGRTLIRNFASMLKR